MEVTLKNNLLTVVIDTHGAELRHITNNITRQEYLWNADRKWWGRCSPVLFPIVGSLCNGKYEMDGCEWTMGQHGFARDMEFKYIDEGTDEGEALFVLESNEETLKKYPRRFELEIRYLLNGERITVSWRVKNTGSKTMHYQIGAHPAFNYPAFDASDRVHGYLMLNKRDVETRLIVADGKISATETQPVATDGDGLIELTSQLFAHDALVLQEQGVNRVSILDKNHAPYLTLLAHAPLVGLWAPDGACPFMCIEPWWGRADRENYHGDFAGRDFVNALEPSQHHDYSYMISVDNI